jgi:sugar lactone lactonase YvrE
MATPDHIPCELVLDARASLGEGPIWDAEHQSLLWVDIDEHEIHRFDPRTGTDLAVAVDAGVTAVAVREQGGLVATTLNGFAFVSMAGGVAEVETIAEPEAATDANRMNDGKCDPAGRFWAGSMSYAETEPSGSLYVLGTDLSVQPVLSGITISNGLGWSPPGTAMYYIDTADCKVTVMDYDPITGEASRRRDLFDAGNPDDAPDGMTVDSDGCLWVAFWGGGAVRRYSPAGELLAVIDVPAALVTSCSFGGPGLADLYITTASHGLDPAEAAATQAGGLFRASTGSRGLHASRFAG